MHNAKIPRERCAQSSLASYIIFSSLSFFRLEWIFTFSGWSEILGHLRSARNEFLAFSCAAVGNVLGLRQRCNTAAARSVDFAWARNPRVGTGPSACEWLGRRRWKNIWRAFLERRCTACVPRRAGMTPGQRRRGVGLALVHCFILSGSFLGDFKGNASNSHFPTFRIKSSKCHNNILWY